MRLCAPLLAGGALLALSAAPPAVAQAQSSAINPPVVSPDIPFCSPANGCPRNGLGPVVINPLPDIPSDITPLPIVPDTVNPIPVGGSDGASPDIAFCSPANGCPRNGLGPVVINPPPEIPSDITPLPIVPATSNPIPVGGSDGASPTAVPEPASLALLSAGLLGLGLVRRRQ